MKDKIQKLKNEKNAIILAHYYTRPEVQAIADFVGDSLALAQKAVSTNADIILFAGVHFMAETAKIINPTKKVLIPDLSAKCSLADSCIDEDFESFLKNYPDYTVLCYVNCSAKVKALSDIIVTSGNALRVVNSLPKDAKIVFAPDKNLGAYINKMTGREMVLWNGACHVHDQLKAEKVLLHKQKFPKAITIAHPECPQDVLQHADFVGSTAAMLTFVRESNDKEFLVVTENGILYELQKQNPDKKFYSILEQEQYCLNCEYMKYNSLENIYNALQTEQPELVMDEALMSAARLPLERMLTF